MSRRRRGHGATNDVVAATASPRAQDPDAGRKASRETRARAAPDPASTTTLTPLTRASYARAGPRRRHKNTVFRTRLSDPERVVQEDLRAVVRCAVAAPAHLRGRRVFCVDKSNPQQERRIERRVSRDRVTARPRRTARALRSLGRTILNSYSRSQREEATKIHAACFGCLPRVRFSSFFVCGCSSASDRPCAERPSRDAMSMPPRITALRAPAFDIFSDRPRPNRQNSPAAVPPTEPPRQHEG